MKINEYGNLAFGTAIYPGAGTGDVRELTYLGLGLGEAGEIQGKLKKLVRDGSLDKKELAKEIGDLFWYATLLSRAIGYKPSDVLQMNIDKLYDRKDRGVLKGNGDNR